MAEHLLRLREVQALLQKVGVPSQYVDEVMKQGEALLNQRVTLHVDNHFSISSGYGHLSKRGHVDFQMDAFYVQLSPAKAKMIADMLTQAAEAAISDEIVMAFLKEKLGIKDPNALGRILLDLREIRQGSREEVNPS